MKKDVSLYFISKVVVGILGIIIIKLYSTLLDPSSYGEYSLVAGFISVLMCIFTGWIGSSALRYYDEYKDRKPFFFANILYYIICMLLATFVIIVLASFLSKSIPIKEYFPFVVFLNIAFSLQDIFEKLLRAAEKTKWYLIASTIQAVSSVVIFYVLAKFMSFDTISIFLSSSLSKLLFVLISVFCLHFFLNFHFVKMDHQLLKKFLKYGIPMIGVWGVGWILNYCDRYIIAIYGNTYDVGIYDISYKISENTINIIISSFTLAIFPILIKAWNNGGKEAIKSKLTECLKYYFMLTLPAIIGIALIVDKIYLGLIDSQYMSGKYIIIIISISCFFNGINNILNKIWQLNEKTKNIFYIMTISVIINILLNFLLIPRYGMIAASITTLVSYFFTTFVTYFFVRKEIHIQLDYISLFKILFACMVMSIFLIIFNNVVHNLFLLCLEVILAVIIYFSVNIVLKNIDIRRK